jgi:hypothetical protein
MFGGKEKIALSQSVVAAIQLTQKMAEVVLGSPLTLIQTDVIGEKIQGQWGRDYAQRNLKTDCVFVDGQQRKHIAVARVIVLRSDGEWLPSSKENYIKCDDMPPCHMRFTVPTDTKPLPPPVVEDEKPLVGLIPLKTPHLDYSKIH